MEGDLLTETANEVMVKLKVSVSLLN